jgi:hypothetical protein
MSEDSPNQARDPQHPAAAARYLSSSEIAVVLRLVSELRSSTLSRNSHALATDLLNKLGGAKPESNCSIAIPE